MEGVQPIVAGSVLGILGALPSAALLERALSNNRTPTVAVGLASVMISFFMLSCTIVAVRVVSRDDVLAFGTAEAVSFLLVWTVEAVRAWRDAQRGASPRERK
ncbi:MAG: hypothetical protein Q4A07_07735 [Coriobacteriales bacterium]|nr:hypothetical protein [Coriobacteriales bacterium]